MLPLQSATAAAGWQLVAARHLPGSGAAGSHRQGAAVGKLQRHVPAEGRHVDIGREDLPRRLRVEVLPLVAAHRAGGQHNAQLPRRGDLATTLGDAG